MFLKEIFFPTSCLVCKKLGNYICILCQKKLKTPNSQTCFYCGKQSYLGLTHPLCRRKKGIDGCIFIYKYNNELKKIIKGIKYKLVKKAFYELFYISSDLIYDRLMPILRLYRNCLLIPVPLFKTKLNKRGFNQTEEISLFLKKHFNIPYVKFLIRKKDTKSQAMLKKRRDRYFNMKGAFSIKNKSDIFKKTFIIVDDVVTSGSTIREAASVLKQNGALKVFVFAIAKG